MVFILFIWAVHVFWYLVWFWFCYLVGFGGGWFDNYAFTVYFELVLVLMVFSPLGLYKRVIVIWVLCCLYLIVLICLLVSVCDFGMLNCCISWRFDLVWFDLLDCLIMVCFDCGLLFWFVCYFGLVPVYCVFWVEWLNFVWLGWLVWCCGFVLCFVLDWMFVLNGFNSVVYVVLIYV